MNNLELIKVVSMEPSFQGEPTPEVLKGFQVLLYRHPEQDTVSLTLDFFTNTLLVSPTMPADRADACIESILVGLRFGYVAAGYKKEGDMWVPQPEHFQSKQ